eukprot:8468094-Prorocentrum_lima.AAC.1
MVPKLQTATDAVRNRVDAAIIMDGKPRPGSAAFSERLCSSVLAEHSNLCFFGVLQLDPGRVQHSALLELFTDEGVGTIISQ